MSRPKFDSRVVADPGWWHWTLTVPLLAAHFGGSLVALHYAVLLCAGMATYYAVRLRALSPMPVQVRLVYLALLACGLKPGLEWLHGVQLVGTTAMVATGYCPLVRLLSLFPGNRSEHLTRAYVGGILFAAAGGGLWNWSSPIALPSAACCSLLRGRSVSG